MSSREKAMFPQMSSMIREQGDALAEAILARQERALPEILPGNFPARPMIRNGAQFLLDYLAVSVAYGVPELFISCLDWARVYFSGLHFPKTALPAMLACTRQVLTERLAEEIRLPALNILDAGLRSLEQAPVVPNSFITGEAPLDDLARLYLDTLLHGDRQKASRMILDAVEKDGLPVRDIYTQVFQRSQAEIGRLWQINQVSVAQEHYCTAVTQMVMSQLYPYIFASQKNGRRMVTTCVGGELHEIGARMVADFFEMEGWDTYFLGANTPVPAVLAAIRERSADVLAISATMTFHVDKVASLIEAVRQAGLDQGTKMIVGGYPFNISAELWRSVGADGYARDARQALQLAENLVAARTDS
jgi:MerR family transcriptional regulator, light-induced transcriptional regulator